MIKSNPSSNPKSIENAHFKNKRARCNVRSVIICGSCATLTPPSGCESALKAKHIGNELVTLPLHAGTVHDRCTICKQLSEDAVMLSGRSERQGTFEMRALGQ